MVFRWVCDCGEDFDGETIEKAGYRALSHLKAAKKAGEPHKIMGLMNTETGEIVQRTFSIKRAQREWGEYVDADAGAVAEEDEEMSDTDDDAEESDAESGSPGSSDPLLPPDGGGESPTAPPMDAGQAVPRRPSYKKKPPDPKKPPEKGGKPSGTMDPKKPKGFQSNMIFTLTGWHMLIPASAIGLFAFGNQIVTRDDGSEYAWTPEGFGDYVWDVFRHWHEERMPTFLGLTYGVEGRDAQIAADRVWEHIERMTRSDAENLFATVQRDMGHAMMG